jgi:hypothetical protein
VSDTISLKRGNLTCFPAISASSSSLPNSHVHAYVLQNDQRAIDTADGVVAQARLHGHHPRVYLVSGHGGCRVTAWGLCLLCWCAEVGGVVLLYYRRVRVAGSVRPGGGARWMREDVGDAAAVGASLMLAGDGATTTSKRHQAAQTSFSRRRHSPSHPPRAT